MAEHMNLCAISMGNDCVLRSAQSTAGADDMYKYYTYTVPYTAWHGVIDGFDRYRARALEWNNMNKLT